MTHRLYRTSTLLDCQGVARIPVAVRLVVSEKAERSRSFSACARRIIVQSEEARPRRAFLDVTRRTASLDKASWPFALDITRRPVLFDNDLVGWVVAAHLPDRIRRCIEVLPPLAACKSSIVSPPVVRHRSIICLGIVDLPIVDPTIVSPFTTSLPP